MKINTFLSSLWKRLINALTTSSEPQISQRRTRDGHLIWLAYDPLADQAINFGSEQEVKTWLDQRYH